MSSSASSSPGPVIEAHNIVKKFGGAIAVDGVSLEVHPGEIDSVVGENGAGKSTLMRLLSGVIPHDSGDVLVEGQPLESGARESIDAGISLVHQELSLVPEMTAAENIMLGCAPPTTPPHDLHDLHDPEPSHQPSHG